MADAAELSAKKKTRPGALLKGSVRQFTPGRQGVDMVGVKSQKEWRNERITSAVLTLDGRGNTVIPLQANRGYDVACLLSLLLIRQRRRGSSG